MPFTKLFKSKTRFLLILLFSPLTPRPLVSWLNQQTYLDCMHFSPFLLFLWSQILPSVSWIAAVRIVSHNWSSSLDSLQSVFHTRQSNILKHEIDHVSSQIKPFQGFLFRIKSNFLTMATYQVLYNVDLPVSLAYSPSSLPLTQYPSVTPAFFPFFKYTSLFPLTLFCPSGFPLPKTLWIFEWLTHYCQADFK